MAKPTPVDLLADALWSRSSGHSGIPSARVTGPSRCGTGTSFACLSRDRVAPAGRSSGSSCSRLQTATAQQPSHV
jgi:hypothetical protein